MTAIWALTAQAIMIAIAYVSACLGAAAFAAMVLLGIDPAELGGSTLPQVVHLSVFALTLAFEAMITVLWPTLVAVIVTEGLKVRGLVPYLAAGCVVGLVHALPIGTAAGGGPASFESSVAQLSVAAGAVGGLVYWMIAGRSAGHWLELRWFDERRWR